MAAWPRDLLGGSLSSYIDAPSVLIVFGGTLGAALTAERLQSALGVMGVVKQVFRQSPGDPIALIEKIVELSNIGRREGVLALESQVVDGAFLAKALRKAVDGLPQEEIRESLTAELVSMKARHKRSQDLFKFMAATAPSMGMIGTAREVRDGHRTGHARRGRRRQAQPGQEGLGTMLRTTTQR